MDRATLKINALDHDEEKPGNVEETEKKVTIDPNRSVKSEAEAFCRDEMDFDKDAVGDNMVCE